MEPLNDDTRRWLDDAVRDEALVPSERARLWKAISASIDAGVPSGVDLEPKPSLLDRAVQLRHVIGIATLVFAAGVVTGRVLSPASAPLPAPTTMPQPATSIAPMPSASMTIATPPAPPPSTSVKTNVTPTPTPARSAPNPESSMDEVRTILRAKQALEGGRPADALVALEEHERRFPHGSLAEERDALRVLALCASGRATEGATERAAFLRAHPFSAYVDRVRAACAP